MAQYFPDENTLNNKEHSINWMCKHTGLLAKHAHECLETNHFSPVTALCSFVQSQCNIPGAYLNEGKRPEVTSTVINDILFEAYCRVFELQKQCGEAELICWATLSQCHWNVQAALNVLQVNTSVSGTKPTIGDDKPFLTSTYFLDTEIKKRAPLFGKHFGTWLNENRDALYVRTKKWSESAAKLYSAPLVLKEIPKEDAAKDVPRIIWQDCVRTFFDDCHRKRLATFLYSLYLEMNNYGQAMSYVGGVLLLSMNEQAAAQIMRKISKEYIPGHWAAEAVGFATNAFVWDFLLKEVEPEVHAHFSKLSFLPDTYLQKIFNGLSIHVLEFDLMYDFLHAFVEEGFPWLLKFATALVSVIKEKILKTDSKDISELYALMRMDVGHVTRSDVEKIFDLARGTFCDSSLKKVEEWRMRAYNEKIEPRLKKAPKEEAFEPCCACEKRRPNLFCDDCGAICDVCHNVAKSNGEVRNGDESVCHIASHSVEPW